MPTDMDTIFDAIQVQKAKDTKSPGPRSKMDLAYDTIQNQKDVVRDQAKVNLSLVADLNPDAEAKVHNLSEKTGLPSNVVRINPNAVAAKTAGDDLENMDPAVADFIAQSPFHAAQVGDDASALDKVIKAHYDFTEKSGVIETMFTEAYRSYKQLESSFDLNTALEVADAQSKVDTFFDLAESGADAATQNAFYSTNLLDDPMFGTAMQAHVAGSLDGASPREVKMLRAAVTGDLAHLSARKIQQSVHAQVVAGSLPSDPLLEALGQTKHLSEIMRLLAIDPVAAITNVTAGSAAASLPSLILGAFTGPVGAGIGSLGVDYLFSSAQVLSGMGIDIMNPAQVQRALSDPSTRAKMQSQGLKHAIPVAILDAISFGIAGKIVGPKLESRIASEAVNLLIQTPIQGVAGGLGEGLGELAQGQALDPWQITAEVIGEIGGAPSEIAFARFNAVHEHEAARAFQGKQQKLNAILQESKTQSRNPGLMQNFLESSGMTQTAWIDGTEAASFLQDNPDVVEKLGISMEQVTQAVADGQDLGIKLSTLHTRLSPEEFSGLSDIIKASPGTRSPKVLAQVNTSEEVDQLVEHYQAFNAEEAIFAEHLDRLRIDGLASGFDTEQVDAWLQTIESFARVVASPEVPLSEAVAKLLKVEKVPYTGKATVEQDGFVYSQAGKLLTDNENFQNWFKAGAVVNEDGSPRVVYHGTREARVITGFDPEIAPGSLGIHLGTIAQTEIFTTRIGSGVFPLYTSIQNPLRLVDMGSWGAFPVGPQLLAKGIIDQGQLYTLIDMSDREDYLGAQKALQEHIRAAGYDSVVYLNRFEGTGILEPADLTLIRSRTKGDDAYFKTSVEKAGGEAHDSYIAFDGTQVKSIYNPGKFSPAQVDMLEQSPIRTWMDVLKDEREANEQEDRNAPTYPRPGDLKKVTLVYGHIEKAFQDLVDSVKDLDKGLTSKALAALPGSPQTRKGGPKLKPRSYADLKGFIQEVRDGGLGERWYYEMGRTLEKLVGKANMQEASIVFGLTSPQTTVQDNLASAVHIMSLARSKGTQGLANEIVGKARPDGKKILLGRDAARRVEAIYNTGTYTGGLKVTNYMRGVRQGARSNFTPFSVLDIHMARVLGFEGSTKTPLQPNQMRYGQFMLSQLAKDLGLSPSEAQAALWFYARQNLNGLSENERLQFGKEGTAAEAQSYARPEIEVLQRQIADGSFSTKKALSPVFDDASLPNFDAKTKTKPYNTNLFPDELQTHAESIGPKVSISAVPGVDRGYGVPMSYAGQAAYNKRVFDRITDGNGKIVLLSRMGIPHEARLTVDSFGELEPSIEVSLPGEGLDLANKISKLLGHALLQTAAIAGQPQIAGPYFGIRATPKIAPTGDTTGSIGDYEALLTRVNPDKDPNGVNFTVEKDGSIRLDNFTDMSEEEFSKAISDTLGQDFDLVSHRFGSEYNDLTEQTGSEIWDEVGLTSRPDLQRAAVRSLYGPVWQEFQAISAGTEAQGKPSPLEEVLGHLSPDRKRDASWNVEHGLKVDEDGQVPLTHWIGVSGLTALDPSQHGTGTISGAEMARKDLPGWVDKTYYGLPGYQREAGLSGGARYFGTIRPSDMYDWINDPLGITFEVSQRNKGKSPGEIANLSERAVARAGYKGYWNGKVAALFEEHPMSEVTSIELEKPRFAGFDAAGKQDAPQKILFQDKEDPRARILGEGDKYKIQLFEKADFSSLMHETAHMFTFEIRNLIATGRATETLINDWNILKEWSGVTQEEGITEDHLERMARGFEAYLREGVAPNQELRSVFDRFKKWIGAIYKSVKQLDVQIDNDVRGVFDRLLATENEINVYSGELGLSERTETEMKALDATEEDKAKVNSLVVRARETAVKIFQKNKDLQRKKLLAQWRRDASAELDNTPIYQIRAALSKKGQGLNVETVREEYGQEMVDRINANRLGMVQKGGQDPAEVANEFGMSVSGMLNSLAESKSKRDAIADLVKAKSETHDSEVDIEGPVLENKDTEAYLEKMARVITKAMGRKDIISTQAIKEYAAQSLADMPLKDALRIDRFLGAMQRNMKEERAHTAKGNLEGALEANQKTRLNYEYARQVKKLQAEVDKFTSRAKRIAKNKGTIAPDYLDNLKAILRKYGVVDTNPAAPEKMSNLKSLMAADDYFEDAPIFEDWLYDTAGETSYKTLSVDDFRDLFDLIKTVQKKGIAVAKGLKEILPSLEISLGDAVQQTVKPLLSLKKKKPLGDRAIFKNFRAGVREYAAANRMFLFLIRAADGFTATGKKAFQGPNEKFLYNNLVKGDNTQRTLKIGAALQLDSILKHFDSRFANRRRPRQIETNVPIPEILAEQDRGWTFERVLAIALNTGTAYNKQAILDGYQLSQQDLDQLFTHLDDSDWEHIQQVWDLVNSFWGQLSDVYERKHGIRPRKVKANSFITPDGRVMEGGYYPLRFDAALSQKTLERDEVAVLRNTAGAAFAPAPASGMLKKRQGTGSLPVNLSLDVLAQHLDYVTNYIAYAEIIRDTDRIISSNEYSSAFKRAFGPEFYKGNTSLKRLLKDIIHVDQERMGRFDKLVNTARNMATRYILGANPSVALKQAYSLPGFVVDVGSEPYLMGLAHVAKNPARAYKNMIELSTAMNERANRVDRDIMTSLESDKKQIARARDFVNFFLIHTVDGMTVTPAWWGVYIDTMNKTDGNRPQAIIEADKAIAASQPFNRVIDMSLHQRSRKGAHVMFTMFSSFTMKFGNRAWYHTQGFKQGKINWAHYGKHLVYERFLPPLLMSLMFSTIRGEDPDWKDVVLDVAMYQFIGLPAVRDITSLIGTSLQNGRNARRIGTPAAKVIDIGQRAIGAIIDLPAALEDAEKKQKAEQAIFDLMSFASGVPASQVARRVRKGMDEIANGEGSFGSYLGIPNYNPKK